MLTVFPESWCSDLPTCLLKRAAHTCILYILYIHACVHACTPTVSELACTCVCVYVSTAHQDVSATSQERLGAAGAAGGAASIASPELGARRNGEMGKSESQKMGPEGLARCGRRRQDHQRHGLCEALVRDKERCRRSWRV